MNEEVEKLRRKLQDLEDQHTTGFVNDAQYAEFRALLERRLVEAVMTSPMPLDALPPAPPPAPAVAAASLRPGNARPRRRLWLGGSLLLAGSVAGVAAWWGLRRAPAPVRGPAPAAPGAGSLSATAPQAATGPAGQNAAASAAPEAASASTAAAQTGAPVIEGTVSLSPLLAEKAAPNDTVFVFVRAPSGPPMPLAVTRARVRDLPLRFRFDDSAGLWTSAKLSSFTSVVIAARISKGGEGTPQPGDLQGQSAAVAVGSTDVQVLIDHQMP
jgi:cytochrome c-type biogenesis protein CcmH